MARVQKGFALTIAILGLLSLIFGLGLAIASWALIEAYKGVSITKTSSGSSYRPSIATAQFSSYWWGGLFYCIPGILGIVAGCTKNVCVMVCYLVFNILCFISSLAVSALVAVFIVLWSAVQTSLDQSVCQDTTILEKPSCKCDDGFNTYWINNKDCDHLKNANSVLVTIMAMAIISSFISFISTYVSCCSLCNQENELPSGGIIIQPGAGNYQPPTAVFVASQTQQNEQQYNPPSYTSQPPYPTEPYPTAPYPAEPYSQGQQDYTQGPPQYPLTHDKAGLIKNEMY